MYFLVLTQEADSSMLKELCQQASEGLLTPLGAGVTGDL